ncbi:hypothetical protein SASPL_147963 [Salvia splendens]|uniref:Uncharacterized protein n=1 Tax=Salvia splendens TaxID=180675 RepID=A0A8X8W944_SALSN|nr:hypothetical protein SASPL_147963 [Salvia splendens]
MMQQRKSWTEANIQLSYLSLSVEVIVKGNNGSSVHSRLSVKLSLQSGYVKAEQNPQEQDHRPAPLAEEGSKRLFQVSRDFPSAPKAHFGCWGGGRGMVSPECGLIQEVKESKIGQGTYSSIYKARNLKSD